MTEPADRVTVADLVGLARLNGLALTEAEAEDLLPTHQQFRRWVAALRQAVEASEEPATIFVPAPPNQGATRG